MKKEVEKASSGMIGCGTELTIFTILLIVFFPAAIIYALVRLSKR